MTEASNNGTAAPLAGSPERSGGLPARGDGPNPEVLARATRRQFTAQYKADIVRRADACKKPGEIGALLRREGLYASQLASWRKQIRQGGTSALTRRRGPAPRPKPSAREVELERKTRKLEKQLAHAKAVIEFQKKCTRSWGSP